MKLSVIVPIYNEKATIRLILSRIKNTPWEKEIILVDDCSTDGTGEYLRSLRDPEVKTVFHSKNQGKGAALRSGFAQAEGDIFIIQDADLEYHPEDYASLIKPITDGLADVVYGSRFIGAHRVFLFSHYLGNLVLNSIVNLLYDSCFTDMMTGYKAFRKEAIKNITLRANGFGVESEITAEVVKRRQRIYEVPISYSGRSYEEGKKINWYHFFEELYWLIRQKLVVSDISLDTLLSMGTMRRYNTWLFKLIKPSIGKDVLEVGGGIGNMTKYLLPSDNLTVTEIADFDLMMLKNNFGIYPHVSVLRHDIVRSNPQELKNRRYDTILCVNVLEHIEDERAALKNMRSLMDEDTRMVLVVPAFSLLYGTLDESVKHFRRYDRKALIRLLEDCGFRLEEIRYFNSLGFLGWLVNSRLLRRKTFSRIQVWIFDRCTWMLILEKCLKPPWGMSLLAVCKKANP